MKDMKDMKGEKAERPAIEKQNREA